MTSAPSSTRCVDRRAFTLVEAVVSIMLIGVVLVAAMRAVGASATNQLITQRRASGMMLAQELAAEILAKDYADPDETPQVLGIEPLEALNDRAHYDDVDDYNGYIDDPISDEQGNAVAGYTGWKREVEVWAVEITSLNTAASGLVDTGVKRIVVTVYCGSTQVASLTAIRTQAHAGDYAGSPGLGG